MCNQMRTDLTTWPIPPATNTESAKSHSRDPVAEQSAATGWREAAASGHATRFLAVSDTRGCAHLCGRPPVVEHFLGDVDEGSHQRVMCGGLPGHHQMVWWPIFDRYEGQPFWHFLVERRQC
jgi:hypothetical protein